ncbi:hypothetical protein D3C76_1808410 [compost metagenome]
MANRWNGPLLRQVGGAGSQVQPAQFFAVAAVQLVAEKVQKQAVVTVQVALFVDGH